MVLSKPPEASCLKFGLNATLCFEEGASKKSKELSFIQSKGWDEKQRGRPDESNKKKRKEREKAQLAGCWCVRFIFGCRSDLFIDRYRSGLFGAFLATNEVKPCRSQKKSM